MSSPWSFPASTIVCARLNPTGACIDRLESGAFKWLLLKSGLDALNFSARLSHGRTGLPALARGIREAETDHAIALLVMVVVTLYAATKGWWAFTSWLVLTNLVANIYPIMLQRLNRARLQPVLAKLRRGSS